MYRAARSGNVLAVCVVALGIICQGFHYLLKIFRRVSWFFEAIISDVC